MVKIRLILAVAAIPATLLLAVPASAKNCIMPATLKSACKSPGSASCKLARTLPLCAGGGAKGPGTSNPCMAGSCIGPVGKPPGEWAAMTERQRQDFVLRMPTAQVNEFTARLQQGQAHH